MKKIIKIIICICTLALILLTPNIILNGAKNGLFLWFNALIPALFPYMIISNIVIYSGLSTNINFIFYPITRILKINPSASYCILSGIFFGYPACAINACTLVNEKMLDKETASFCTCAFNNISPGFIMGYFCIGMLDNSSYIPLVLFLFYISLLLSTIIIRIFLFKKLNYTNIEPDTITAKQNKQKNIIQNSIRQALTNISILGGYVIIFSIIINYLQMIPFKQIVIITPLFEITSGIANICSFIDDIRLRLLIIMPMLAFGGLSGIFQTFAIDCDRIIEVKKYIYSKVISCITCFVITYLTVYVFNIIT